MNGIINIDKPSGISSFDVIRRLRKILKTKKIGHTGTLDPLASGVLVMCVGKATKLATLIESTSKTYIAKFDLGYKTDTYDSEGKVIDKIENFDSIYDTTNEFDLSHENFKNICDSFIGEIEQVPPMYSAIKINGKRLYELARQGVTVERKARKVTIEDIKILDFNQKSATISCTVSKGTYIRSLIYDIGEKLRCFATMTELTRTKVGDYDIKNSYSLDDIEKIYDTDNSDIDSNSDTNNLNLNFLKTVEESFNYQKIEITDDRKIMLYNNGNTIIIFDNNKENNERTKDHKDGFCRVYNNNNFLGLAIITKHTLKGFKYYNIK